MNMLINKLIEFLSIHIMPLLVCVCASVSLRRQIWSKREEKKFSAASAAIRFIEMSSRAVNQH